MTITYQNLMHQLPSSPQNPELKEVLDNYVTGLQELTVSAKVPINILTMIAEENKLLASDIVRIIETRIQTSQVELRLPTFHLMDSIIKNVGEPYLSLFSHNIVANFISSYAIMSVKVQESMLRLLQTWKDIYPLQFSQITNYIAQLYSLQQPAVNPLLAKVLPPAPQENRVINPNVSLPLPSAYSLPQPAMVAPSIPGLPPALPQPVYPQIAPTINQNDLQQLYDRLRDQLIASQVAVMQTTPPPVIPQTHPLPSEPRFKWDKDPRREHKKKPLSPPRVRSPTSFRTSSPIHPSSRSPTHPSSRSPTHPSSRSPIHTSSRSPIHPSSRSPIHTSSRSPTHPSSLSHPSSDLSHLPKHKPSHLIDNKDKTIGTSFSRDVLKRKHSYLINHLYNSSWAQCPTCALRLEDPNKLSDHLDWHFKKNRREKEKFKKPLSREWFLPTDEWISYQNPELSQPTVPQFFEAPKEQSEEKKLKSVVKVDGHFSTCSVCLEPFETYYDSDEDEWMFKGAVETNGTMCHDSCAQDLSPTSFDQILGKRSLHPSVDHVPAKYFKLDY